MLNPSDSSAEAFRRRAFRVDSDAIMFGPHKSERGRLSAKHVRKLPAHRKEVGEVSTITIGVSQTNAQAREKIATSTSIPPQGVDNRNHLPEKTSSYPQQ